MASKKKSKKIDASMSEKEKLLEEAQQHEHDSYKYYDEQRSDWDEKESILVAELEDSVSGKTHNEVFDPILSSMTIERSARVMAQNATGKAWAVSKNDLGKNMLMNLLFKHFRKNANEKWSHLVKLRLMDVYSNVHGSSFAIVPWRVNLQQGYVGPEVLPLKIQDVRPQPYRVSPGESDWFTVRDVQTITWLENQNPEVWDMKAIENLREELETDEDPGDYEQGGQENETYLEENKYPTQVGDVAFPNIEMFTEYRRDKWITWTPRRNDKKKSRPHILRVVENKYPEGMLPIVVKHAFPLIDSMIGLGDFERGKTLQFATNSLWNLYLTGVKYSIFPPLHVDPNNVVPSSVKWGEGEMWFMNQPNKDVQAMKMSPLGLNTFTSTYNYMQSALQNMAGTTQVSSPVGAESSLGRTPEAIKRQSFKESARDEWDRFMMEDTLKSIYERWTALITHELDSEQVIRVYGPELQDIQRAYPQEDVLQIFESGEQGKVTVNKDLFMEQDEDGNAAPVSFDFEIDAGSTMKRNPEEEGQFLTALLDTYTSNPELLAKIEARGKTIDFAELNKRILMNGPVKDWDRILIDIPTEGEGMTGEGSTSLPQTPPIPGQAPQQPGASPVQGVPTPGGASENPNAIPANGGVQIPQINDPDIQAVIEASRGAFGANEIPTA